MRAGRVVWDSNMERLRAEAPPGAFRLVTSDDGRALSLATKAPSVRAQYGSREGLIVTADSAALDALVLALAAEGIAVRRLEETMSSVEAIFMSLTAADGPTGKSMRIR
jgi:ABC-2 type transport system ATP-binding protein